MFHGYLVFGWSAQALCHSEHSRHTGEAFAWWRASFGTLPQRFHVGIHHSPRTMSNTYSTHTHTNVHRVHLVNGQPGQQPARRSTSLQRWEANERPTHRHASPCPIRWCGRHQLCTAPPAFHTWRQHQGHVCQHLRPRKLRGNCAWPKSVPP